MQFHTLSATLHRGPREVTSLESTPRDLGDICAIAGRLSKDEGPWALETADGGWRHGPEARDGPSCLPLFPAQPWIPVYKPSSFYFYPSPLLITAVRSIPLLCLEGVPDLHGAPQVEASLMKKFET